jgi:hypothetical protein
LATASQACSRLKNGGFQVDQRGNNATARADDAYGLDCWYTLTQTASIQVTQQTLQESGSSYSIRLTQNQASAQRMGVAQIVEARDSQPDRGQTIVLAARVRISNSQAVRYAILEWTGTADSVTSDVVADWTSGSYAAGGFFLGSNLTVTAIGTLTPAANTWTDISASGTLGSSVNNLIVLVWTEGTAAQNVTLDLARARLHRGAVALPFEHRPMREDLADCRRYLPAFSGTASAFANGQATGTTGAVFVLPLDIRPRIKPTGIVVSNVSHFSASNSTGGTIQATNVTFANSELDAVVVNVTVASGLTAGNAAYMLYANTSAQLLCTGVEL